MNYTLEIILIIDFYSLIFSIILPLIDLFTAIQITFDMTSVLSKKGNHQLRI